MLAKISRKNQLTLPKKVVERLGFSPDEAKYVDVVIEGNTAIMKPVTVTIEEKIGEEQWKRFRERSLDHTHDLAFEDEEEATHFLKKRLRKK